MQNYHTQPQQPLGPLTAILAALSTADPQRGMTAMQIAKATNLNLVMTVIPALRGYLSSDVITAAPVQQREGMSFVLSQPPVTISEVNDTGELEAHLVDAGDMTAPIAPPIERPSCHRCHGTGKTHFYMLGMRYPQDCQACHGTGVEV